MPPQPTAAYSDLSDAEKEYFFQIVRKYQDKLTEVFLHTPMTTHTLSAARAMLDTMMRSRQRYETHRAWFVPLHLSWDSATYSMEIGPGRQGDGLS